MPKFATSQEWLEQSALLLKAYPTTTKITTKYNIPHPTKVAKSQARRSRKTTAGEDSAATQSSSATIEVRAYNPDAGVLLKYQTNKGWEVGRLLAGLGRLGRHMAALPEIAEDTVMTDVKEEAAGSGTGTPVPGAEAKGAPVAQGQAQQGGGGGGKKKKKGKR